jgi:hypothetical protein
MRSAILAAAIVFFLAADGLQARPLLVGDPRSGFIQGRMKWFNTAASAAPPPGRFGSSRRNILDGRTKPLWIFALPECSVPGKHAAADPG